MRIYSTVQLCSITSLWHSGQHLCRAIGRLQVRISQGFWLLSKRRSLWSWLLWKKTFLAGLQCTLTSSCAIMISNNRNIQLYVHRKIEFVTVNQNSLNYGGGKIVFHRSVVKACFVFRNHHCPILKIALHRLQLRIMSGPAGIRFNQSCLVVRPDGNFPIRCTSNSCTQKQYTWLIKKASQLLLRHSNEVSISKLIINRKVIDFRPFKWKHKRDRIRELTSLRFDGLPVTSADLQGSDDIQRSDTRSSTSHSSPSAESKLRWRSRYRRRRRLYHWRHWN